MISICISMASNMSLLIQNLDNWKFSRRKRQEHIIERVVEVKKFELEEFDRNRRRSKTFSEMLEERWLSFYFTLLLLIDNFIFILQVCQMFSSLVVLCCYSAVVSVCSLTNELVSEKPLGTCCICLLVNNYSIHLQEIIE